MVLLNHFVPFFITKSPYCLGVHDDFGLHPDIQKSRNPETPEIQKSRNRRQVVEAWLSVAMRSMAGLAGLTGVPLLQALGATAKAGDLPLPLGFPLKSLGGVVHLTFFGGFSLFSLDFLGTKMMIFTWHHLTFGEILMIFRMFKCWALRKPWDFVFFFSQGFVGWWSRFLGRKQRRWGTWPNGIFTSNLANKGGNHPVLNRLVVYKKGPKMGCSPKSTTIFFWGYFGPFGGSHPKNPAITWVSWPLSRLGGVGSIDAFIQESEKSLATHVGLFSLKLERLAPGWATAKRCKRHIIYW